jgi:hypothetical protein
MLDDIRLSVYYVFEKISNGEVLSKLNYVLMFLLVYISCAGGFIVTVTYIHTMHPGLDHIPPPTFLK